MDGWKTIVSFWGPAFSEVFLLCFRECNSLLYWEHSSPRMPLSNMILFWGMQGPLGQLRIRKVGRPWLSWTNETIKIAWNIRLDNPHLILRTETWESHNYIRWHKTENVILLAFSSRSLRLFFYFGKVFGKKGPLDCIFTFHNCILW